MLNQTQEVLETQVEDNKEEEEAEEAEDVAAIDIYDLLGTLPNAPSKEQIEYWKKQNGANASIFSDNEVYIWRPINWAEYKMLQNASVENQHNPNYMDEQLVYKCVLWPKVTPDMLPVLKGGTIPTLAQQIMEGSNFVPPNIAMNLVVKL